MRHFTAQEISRPAPEGQGYGRVCLDRRFQRHPLKIKGERFSTLPSSLHDTQRHFARHTPRRSGPVCDPNRLAPEKQQAAIAPQYTIRAAHAPV